MVDDAERTSEGEAAPRGEVPGPTDTAAAPRSVTAVATKADRPSRSARRRTLVAGAAIVTVTAMAIAGWSRGWFASPISITDELESSARSADDEADVPDVVRLDATTPASSDRPVSIRTTDASIDEPVRADVAGMNTETEIESAELTALLGSRPVLVSFSEPRVVVTEDGRRHAVGDAVDEGVSLVAIEQAALVFDRDGDRHEVPLPASLASGGTKVE